MAPTSDARDAKGEQGKLPELWTRGLFVDWNRLYGEAKPRKISLPTYPFAKDRYWVPDVDNALIDASATASLKDFPVCPPVIRRALHPGNPQVPAVSGITAKPNAISLRSLSDDQTPTAQSYGESGQSAASSPPDVLKRDRRVPQPETFYHPTFRAESLMEELKTSLSEAVHTNRDDIEEDEKFVDMGLDSIMGVEWLKAINKRYGTSLKTAKIYDYPSIREFAGFLETELRKRDAGPGQSPSESTQSCSLDELVRQVHSGSIDIEQADQLLQQFRT